MVNAPLDGGRVAALRAIALRFGGTDSGRKARLLRECAAREPGDPAVLIAYHDCLLCLLAYPESPALRQAAERELRRVAAAARRTMVDAPARLRAKLANSGIAWTPITMQFGWELVRWLAARYPERAEIDSFDDGVPLQVILAEALPAIEFELAAGDESSDEFLERASAGRRGSKLAWLVAAFERLPCSHALREHLYDSLRAFVTLDPADSPLSRTFVRAPPARIHYQRRELERGVDLARLLTQPLAQPRALGHRERASLLDAARGMLASLGRETDAISLADPGALECHDVGRGVRVALFPMRADRRSPLDSHIGMMVYKNRLPVAYGGGWPLLGTCRIGVNIFEPYRGGESAYVFGQVLRVYRGRFAVGRFVAEASQYGGTNKEGLRSGAFWFYYRLGFRPVEARSAALARDEWARIRSDPAYRTPVAALRRFTSSDIELALAEVPSCEPAALSDAVSDWIARRHGGDRSAAERAAQARLERVLGIGNVRGWSDDERRALRELGLLLAQIPGLGRWSRADKRAVVAIVRAKARDELAFHALLAAHPPTVEALVRLAGRAH